MNDPLVVSDEQQGRSGVSSEFDVGDLVTSVAGRDKAKIYAVVGFQNGRVLLSEGSRRTLKRPKKKNPNHVVKVGRLDRRIASRLTCRRAGDEEIKRSIGAFCDESTEDNGDLALTKDLRSREAY